MWCIPRNLTNKFLEKVKSGEITPEKLNAMTSEERRGYFASVFGEGNAQKVNSLFESKLLLKNQKKAIVTWAKQVTGIKPEVRRDMLAKVERMTEVLKPADMNRFLSDLAAQRLGIEVTVEEAGKIADLAKEVADRKKLITESSPRASKERMEYGTALTVFKDYVSELKTEAQSLTVKELLTSPGKLLESIAGTTKSLLSSLDNSFFGRQGLVTLVNKPKIWLDNFVKSWGDISQELMGVDAMTPIKADVFSRENALNGKYRLLKLDIGLDSEEAFPSSIPEKIPLFNRLYKASETAFNGAALRMRADLADVLIKQAEDMGVDLAEEGEGIGRLVNSMTGRGALKLTEEQAKFLNITIFSVKWIKSQIDVLTAHMFDKKVGKFARKKASENLIRLIGTMAGLLFTAKWLDPDSVDLDPRSSDFGKIMIGPDHKIKINVTGGFNSIPILASRVIPTRHDGQWGFWKKTSSGWKQMGTGKYGVDDSIDLFVNFITGKASPAARVVLDVLQGRTFDYEKPTLKGELTGIITPLPVQNIYELAKSDADVMTKLLLGGLEMLGVSSYQQKEKTTKKAKGTKKTKRRKQ